MLDHRTKLESLPVIPEISTPRELRGIEWFRTQHPELAWSNRKAGERVLIALALSSARFKVILDAILAFGYGRVCGAWVGLRGELSMHPRVIARTDRILRNVQRGLERATEEMCDGASQAEEGSN